MVVSGANLVGVRGKRAGWAGLVGTDREQEAVARWAQRRSAWRQKGGEREPSSSQGNVALYLDLNLLC